MQTLSLLMEGEKNALPGVDCSLRTSLLRHWISVKNQNISSVIFTCRHFWEMKSNITENSKNKLNKKTPTRIYKTNQYGIGSSDRVCCINSLRSWIVNRFKYLHLLLQSVFYSNASCIALVFMLPIAACMCSWPGR